MKITTYIDEALLKRAMKAMRARTQREAIEEGLKRVLAEAKHIEFSKSFGEFEVGFSYEDLMAWRKDDGVSH